MFWNDSSEMVFQNGLPAAKGPRNYLCTCAGKSTWLIIPEKLDSKFIFHNANPSSSHRRTKNNGNEDSFKLVLKWVSNAARLVIGLQWCMSLMHQIDQLRYTKNVFLRVAKKLSCTGFLYQLVLVVVVALQRLCKRLILTISTISLEYRGEVSVILGRYRRWGMFYVVNWTFIWCDMITALFWDVLNTPDYGLMATVPNVRHLIRLYQLWSRIPCQTEILSTERHTWTAT